MNTDNYGFYISVVIPLYNKEASIGRAVKSVLSQTYTNFHVIIINDGSTDNSREVVEKFNDSRIYIHDQNNLGEAAARNIGIQLSRFPYVAMLDADDEWRNNHLSTIANLINKYPHASFYGTSFDYVSTESKIVEYASKIYSKNRVDRDRLDYIRSIANGVYPIYSSTIALNRHKLQSQAPFNVNLEIGTDISTWIQMSLVESPVFSHIPTVIYHQDSENRSTSVSSYDAKKLRLLYAISSIYESATLSNPLFKGLKYLKDYIGLSAYSLYCDTSVSSIRTHCLSILRSYSRYYFMKAFLRTIVKR